MAKSKEVQPSSSKAKEIEINASSNKTKDESQSSSNEESEPSSSKIQTEFGEFLTSRNFLIFGQEDNFFQPLQSRRWNWSPLAGISTIGRPDFITTKRKRVTFIVASGRNGSSTRGFIRPISLAREAMRRGRSSCKFGRWRTKSGFNKIKNELCTVINSKHFFINNAIFRGSNLNPKNDRTFPMIKGCTFSKPNCDSKTKQSHELCLLLFR